MRGRLPTPTALKLLRGNPSHRPINPDEPEITVAEPCAQPPKNLTPGAREEWFAQFPILTASRVLTKADIAVFAMYCRYYDMWQVYDLEMQKKGPYGIMRKRNRKGEEVGDAYSFYNPAWVVMNRSALMCNRFAAELGMTPSARSRVKGGGHGEGNTAADMRARLRA